MRIIAHLDMDAFFAAIEERENPQYRGFGVVVGADPKNGLGRGVVSTANYQARKYGIHSAMPISIAWRLSQTALKRGEPKTFFVPGNHHFYSEVSHQIFAIILKHVSLIEQTSVDEAYLDLSFTENFESAKHLVDDILKEIDSRQHLSAKVGIASNKLLAKILTIKSKPNTVSILYPHKVQEYLDPLSVADIPGVGPKTMETLNKKNIFTIRDLRNTSKEELLSVFGKWGEGMYFRARGIDDSPIETEREIKSISEQETFDEDTLSASILLSKLQELSEKVMERMKIEKVEGYRTVTLVVRFSDFTTKNRAHTLKHFSVDLETLKKESLKLFFPFMDRRENPEKKPIRLLGVGIEGFERPKVQVVSQQLKMVS